MKEHPAPLGRPILVGDTITVCLHGELYTGVVGTIRWNPYVDAMWIHLLDEDRGMSAYCIRDHEIVSHTPRT